MEASRSILVVEDEAAIRDAVNLVLRIEGYQVAVAADGGGALDYLRSHPPPCVVLLDLRTPRVDGWAFRREQLRDPALAAITVIVVSGADDVQREAASLHAAGYIQKPIEPRTLLTTVEMFACCDGREVLLVEDDPGAGPLLMRALEHHGITVHLARSGSEAMQIYRERKRFISLVVLDAQSEAAGGERTLASLREVDPAVRYCLINCNGMTEPLPKTGATLDEAARILKHLARPA